MNRVRIAVAAVAMSLSTAGALSAQTCIGLPPIFFSRFNLGADAQATDGAKGIGLRFGAAGERAFGGVSTAYVKYDDADVGANTYGAEGGFSLAPSASSRIRICPIVGLDYQTGPNFEQTPVIVSTNALSGSLGIAVGGSLNSSPTFDVVPFARASLLTVRTKLSSLGTDETSTETGGMLGGGVSFRVGQLFVVSPGVMIPVGFDSADPVYSLRVTLGFRHRGDQ
jgi:hypothetical protein